RPRQQLALSASCANPGGRACTAAAYLGGFAGKQPAVATPGEPESTRVALHCPPTCSALVPVPAGRTLRLTDLVFGNASGERGVGRLQLGSQTLLRTRIDGLNDLPFRFAAPIVVRPGEKLELSMSCANPHQRACTAGAYVGGLATKAPAP